MSDMTKMREEFELALMKEQFPHKCESDIIEIIKSWESDDEGYFVKLTTPGKYVYDWVEWSWWGWKTSRESLCIELPKKQEFKQYDMDFVRMPAAGRNKVIDELVEILEKAGVNYK